MDDVDDLPEDFWNDGDLTEIRDSTHDPKYPFGCIHDRVSGSVKMKECNHPTCVARTVMES